MNQMKSHYDVVIVGGGHNGLISALYLAKKGLSVLILEKNPTLGGLVVSEAMFSGIDIKLSRYAYLVGLIPQKILADLNINFPCKKRDPGVFLPYFHNNQFKELVFSEHTSALETFSNFPDAQRAYKEFTRFRGLQDHLAKYMWSSLLQPLVTKSSLKKLFTSADEALAWDLFIEHPLGMAIEQLVTHDLLRGLIMTDGVIGCFTHAQDKTLKQNRTFLYHVLANGSGEWNVPVGGMEVLINQLVEKCLSYGVTITNHAEVTAIHPEQNYREICYILQEKNYQLSADYVLSNTAPQVLQSLLPQYDGKLSSLDEGSYVKINMVLAKLPKLKSGIDPKRAFTGTFHINEGYNNLEHNYKMALLGKLPEHPAGEIYCHSLTDNTIIPNELSTLAYQTMTLLGLCMPYKLFVKDNETVKAEILRRYFNSLNQYLAEPIQDCLAKDTNHMPCVTIESPYDVEQRFNLPTGHVFHKTLDWPFVENTEEVNSWGVETGYKNIFLCGSGAKRGGGLSGISGHNAAMKVMFTKNHKKLT